MLNTKQCDQDRLLKLFEDRLNQRQRAAAEEHVAACDSCQQQLEKLAGGEEWLGQVKQFFG